jgi:hypothetical protein
VLDDYNSEVLIDAVADALETLCMNFPDFKVNLLCSGGLTIPKNPHPDKFAYCLHGWSHKFWDEVSDEELDKWPYDKVYKAPYWELSDEMYKRLYKHGYKILLNEHDPREGIRWNWSINTRPDSTKDVLISNGHVSRSIDNVADCMNFILSLPKDTKFGFVRDL